MTALPKSSAGHPGCPARLPKDFQSRISCPKIPTGVSASRSMPRCNGICLWRRCCTFDFFHLVGSNSFILHPDLAFGMDMDENGITHFSSPSPQFPIQDKPWMPIATGTILDMDISGWGADSTLNIALCTVPAKPPAHNYSTKMQADPSQDFQPFATRKTKSRDSSSPLFLRGSAAPPLARINTLCR